MSTMSTPLVDELLKQSESTRVKDKVRVEKILAGLVVGGVDALQFVVDFDYTLTRVHLNGEKVSPEIAAAPCFPVLIRHCFFFRWNVLGACSSTVPCCLLTTRKRPRP